MNNSKRMYSVQSSMNGLVYMITYDILEIIKPVTNDERIFAMLECIDEILDLKLHESLYFQPNRDDKSSKGIITRVA